jgi:hypothetical protein
MNNRTLIGASLLAGLAASLVGGAGIAAAKEAAVSSQTVLDLSQSSGGGAGKVSLQDFSFSLSSGSRKGAARAAAPDTGPACPSSSETARWKAPELNSSSDRAAASTLPPGPGCLSVKTSRDAASGQATGRRKGWDGCVKGSHIASANLVHRDLAYRFTDVTVVECSAEGMVLSFADVSRSSSSAPAGVHHEVR